MTPIGRNTDSTWWHIQSGSTKCWISASTGHTTGSVSSLPVVGAPPTPTIAVTSTTVAGPSLSDPVALVGELSYPNGSVLGVPIKYCP